MQRHVSIHHGLVYFGSCDREVELRNEDIIALAAGLPRDLEERCFFLSLLSYGSRGLWFVEPMQLWKVFHEVCWVCPTEPCLLWCITPYAQHMPDERHARILLCSLQEMKSSMMMGWRQRILKKLFFFEKFPTRGPEVGIGFMFAPNFFSIKNTQRFCEICDGTVKWKCRTNPSCCRSSSASSQTKCEVRAPVSVCHLLVSKSTRARNTYVSYAPKLLLNCSLIAGLFGSLWYMSKSFVDSWRYSWFVALKAWH